MLDVKYPILIDGELYHYGVKGQRWGVRRYQDTNGRLTALGKQHVKDKKINVKIADYIKRGKAKVTELESYKVGDLTEMTMSNGKKVISGLMNGHDFDWREVTRYGEYDDWTSPAKAILDNPNAHKIKDERINKSHDAFRFTDDDLTYCNPFYGKDGTVQNCMKCSAAMELRLRGYDVSAGRQTWPSSEDANQLWFKDAKRVDYNYDDAQEALISYGPKTSGSLSFRHIGDKETGHAVHWTNDEDGVFSIQDGQNGKTFNSINEMMDAYKGDKARPITTFRLDSCELNLDAMEQDSVIRRLGNASKVRNIYSNEIVDEW